MAVGFGPVLINLITNQARLLGPIRSPVGMGSTFLEENKAQSLPPSNGARAFGRHSGNTRGTEYLCEKVELNSQEQRVKTRRIF